MIGFESSSKIFVKLDSGNKINYQTLQCQTALERGHPAFLNNTFLISVGHFALLDPDPDTVHQNL